MADTSNLSKFLTDVADAIRTKKETTESIPAANFDSEILSIESGIDTSDADATENDIASGKTAYVNGEKITGKIFPVMGDWQNDADEVSKPFEKLRLKTTMPVDYLFRKGTGIELEATNQAVAEAEGITSDKIVKGNTIFGVEGTAEAGAAEVQFKLYETMDEMYADTDVKENDLAIVYRNDIRNATQDSVFSQATFPSTVVLPTAITTNSNIRYESADSSQWFDCRGNISSTEFYMSCYGDAGSIDIRYESSDGITYTRADDGEELIDFGMNIRYSTYAEWIPAIGYFIQVSTDIYDGFYKYMNFDDENFITMYKGLSHSYEDTTLKVHYAETGAFPIHKYLSVIDAVRRDAGITSYGSMLCSYDVNNPNTLSLYYWKWNSTSDYCNHLDLSTEDDSKIYISTTYDSTGMVYEKIVMNLISGEYEKTQITSTGTIVNGIINVYEVLPTDNFVFIVYINGGNIQWSDGIRFESYNSTHGTGQYDYSHAELPNVPENKTTYKIAPSQLTLANPNELLPGKIGYGKNGPVTGDDSIYDNLDYNNVLSQLGLPVLYNSSMYKTDNREKLKKANVIYSAVQDSTKDSVFFPLRYSISYKPLLENLNQALSDTYTRIDSTLLPLKNGNFLGSARGTTNSTKHYFFVTNNNGEVLLLEEVFTTTNDDYKFHGIVDDDALYIYSAYSTNMHMFKISREDGSILNRNSITTTNQFYLHNAGMTYINTPTNTGHTSTIFTDIGDNFVIISLGRNTTSNIIVVNKNLEKVKELTFTNSGYEYTASPVTLNGSVFWATGPTTTNGNAKLWKYDVEANTVSSIDIGTNSKWFTDGQIMVYGDYIYVSDDSGTYTCTSDLEIIETNTDDKKVFLLGNNYYHVTEFVDYKNYTCWNMMQKFTVKNGVWTYPKDCVSFWYDTNDKMLFLTHIYKLNGFARYQSDYLTAYYGPVDVDYKEGVVHPSVGKILMNDVDDVSVNIIDTSELLGTITPTEYNTALDTAQDILSEEVTE